jgi:alpha-ribazole phosphatase
MRLILIRHPKPQCENGICYGRLDLECDPQALSEAVSRLRSLASASLIFTSPARRARDLAAQLGTQTTVDDRLQELDFGDWEGRRWQDLGRHAIDAWSQGLPDSAPPNGETLTAMAGRCAAWIKSLQPSESPVLAVTHAGPIRIMKSILNGESLLTYFTEAIPFAEPIELQLQDGAIVTR